MKEELAVRYAEELMGMIAMNRELDRKSVARSITAILTAPSEDHVKRACAHLVKNCKWLTPADVSEAIKATAPRPDRPENKIIPPSRHLSGPAKRRRSFGEQAAALEAQGRPCSKIMRGLIGRWEAQQAENG
jgi:hypothetical protein